MSKRSELKAFSRERIVENQLSQTITPELHNQVNDQFVDEMMIGLDDLAIESDFTTPVASSKKYINPFTAIAKFLSITDKATSAEVTAGANSGKYITPAGLKPAMDAKADLVSGKVPSSQLPSYVDSVVEVSTVSALPTTGVASTIYIARDTSFVYRWGGTVYVRIVASPGTTDQVPESGSPTNLYFTVLRVLNSVLGSLTGLFVNSEITGADNVKQAFGKLQGQINGINNANNSTFVKLGIAYIATKNIDLATFNTSSIIDGNVVTNGSNFLLFPYQDNPSENGLYKFGTTNGINYTLQNWTADFGDAATYFKYIFIGLAGKDNRGSMFVASSNFGTNQYLFEQIGSVKKDYNSTTDPTTSYTTSKGWRNGSRIWNNTNSTLWECINANTGAWIKIYPQAGGGGGGGGTSGFGSGFSNGFK